VCHTRLQKWYWCLNCAKGERKKSHWVDFVLGNFRHRCIEQINKQKQNYSQKTFASNTKYKLKERERLLCVAHWTDSVKRKKGQLFF